MFDSPVTAAVDFNTLEPVRRFPAGTPFNVTVHDETRGDYKTGIKLCRWIEVDGNRFLILNDEMLKAVGDPWPASN